MSIALTNPALAIPSAGTFGWVLKTYCRRRHSTVEWHFDGRYEFWFVK